MKEASIIEAAASVFGNQSVLSDKVLRAVITRITHRDLDLEVSMRALGNLYLPQALPKTIVAVLYDLYCFEVESTAKQCRKEAIEVLKILLSASTISTGALKVITTWLRDHQRFGDHWRPAKLQAFNALRGQLVPSAECTEAVVAALEDKNSLVRWRAAWVLNGQPSIFDIHINAVAVLPDDEEKDV